MKSESQLLLIEGSDSFSSLNSKVGESVENNSVPARYTMNVCNEYLIDISKTLLRNLNLIYAW